jgi:hypothetical protein
MPPAFRQFAGFKMMGRRTDGGAQGGLVFVHC